MKQFEYRTIELYYQAQAKEFQYHEPAKEAGSYQTHTLNEFGKQGWELVTLTEQGIYESVGRSQPRVVLIGVFKREK